MFFSLSLGYKKSILKNQNGGAENCYNAVSLIRGKNPYFRNSSFIREFVVKVFSDTII